MGRPPLPLGTAGSISVKKEGPKKWCARCRYRDYDGRIYHIERYGESSTKAENRVKEAVRDWVSPVPQAGINRDTKFKVVAAQWLKEFEQDAENEYRSWGSVDTYRSRLDGVVLKAVGELRMHEVSTPILDALCRKVRDQSSASSAKTVRAILSGVCSLAVRHGAIDVNPVREISPLESKKAKHKRTPARALSGEQVIDLLTRLDADEQAVRDDLPDLVRFFLGTGERTGEALGAHWPDFDRDEKLIRMEGNVIRARGKGKIMNRGKTENSARPIPLAEWCVSMLTERQQSAARLDGPIFPSSTGTVREASNVRNRAWKPFTVRAGYDWVTFRTFRKTVATLLDDAGLTARQIADILGHARPSMTQDVYMGRGAVSRAGAQALDDALTRAKE